MAVDTHVFRVANRTHLASGKNVVIVENELQKINGIRFPVVLYIHCYGINTSIFFTVHFCFYYLQTVCKS